MQRGLGGSVFEPVQESEESLRSARDRELTLGPAMLLTLGVILFALCAACFVFGYGVGRRSFAESAGVAAPPTAGTPAMAQVAIPASKPSAGQSGAQPQQPAAVADQPDSAAEDSKSLPAPVEVSVPTGSNGGAVPAGTSQPAIHSALPGQSAGADVAASPGSGVQPALAQASAIMVQIAAVSHPEDADVLVGALRKRGYAVSAHRDPADGLLHVQVGPFANRNDAVAMRQKLLNDGYNAIVEP
jgi:cell division septation protein DedD